MAGIARPTPPAQDIDWQPGQGGNVNFDRLQLEIGPGAFVEPVRLHLAVPSDKPPVPENLFLAYVFRLEAKARDGRKVKRLGQSIRLSVDFADLSPSEYGRGFVALFYFDEAARRWLKVPTRTDMKRGTIVAELDHFTDFGFGPDRDQDPSTPSNLEGFQVDLCTGYAKTSIALKVPPGTGGLTPRLELTYSSGAIEKMNEQWIQDGDSTGNENTRTRLQASPVGLGWSLDLGAVFRKRVESGNWPFYLVLNGQTLELAYVDGTTYRTKPDDFLRVRRLTGSPNNECVDHEYWVIETKDGVEYRFGYNADSELKAGKWNFGGTQIAWQWNLDRIKDLHGNTIEISYDTVAVMPPAPYNDEYYDQAAYPSVISYTSNPGQGFSANREIRFYYSDRTDHATHSGYTYTQYYWKKKLHYIEMKVGGNLTRKYEFSYDYKTPYWHPMDSDSQTEGLSKLVLTQLVEKDASGNALPAMVFTYGDGPIPNTSDYYRTQLIEAANGYGGNTSFKYAKHTPNGWQSLKHRFRVTEQRTESGMGSAGGTDSTIVLNYDYGTSYNVGGSWDYRGHEWVKVIDSQGNYEKSWFYTRDAVNGKSIADVEVLQSRRYQSERWKSGGGNWTVHEETAWGYTATAGGANFVKVDSSWHWQDNVSRKTYYYYDSYGNLMRTRECDSVSAAESAWVRNTRRWYNQPVSTSTKYIVGKPAKETVYKPGSGDPTEGDWVKSTHYCYDGSYYWNSTMGSSLYGDDGSYRARLTAVRSVLSTSLCVDVTYGYDAYGNRTSQTEYGGYGSFEGSLATGDARSTTVGYESTYHSFPEWETNALNQTATALYDAKWGKPAQITDVNGGATDYGYDGFGRLTSAQGPQVAGPGGNYRRTAQYQYLSPATANGRTTTQLVIQKRIDTGGATASWLTTRRFFDGIGRVVQEYSDAYSGVSTVSSYYDSRGLKWRDSVAHAGTSTALFLDSDWASYAGAATTYTYDELRRPRITTLPDSHASTVETRYSGWSTTSIYQNGHGKRHDKDALGRTVAVIEYSGTDPNLTQYASTSYGYDLLDRLTGVTDHAGNSTSITYDALGRKMNMTDPDMGAWSYDYDPVGTLKSQTDAKGQTTKFYYDKLKRLVRKWYPVCWAEETITAGTSRPTVYDLMELRCGVDVDRKAAGLAATSWTDPAIVAGKNVPIRAVHFNELQSSIQALWTLAGMGTIPQFSGGAIVAGTRVIKAGDPGNLRAWLQDYENSAYGQTKRARAYYEYDAWDGSTQFGRGKRTAMWDACGSQTVVWDKAGRMKSEERKIDGAGYTTQWTYDALDRVYQVTLPDGEALTHSYAGNGLLSQISSSLGSTYLSGVQYNALNQPKQYTLGSGTTALVSNTYYGPDATGWPYGALKTIQLQQGSNPMLVNRDMGYDYAGNITSVNDLVNSENISHGYDHVDRLISAGSPLNESYVYNEIGNMTSKGGATLYYNDAAHKHAVTSYNGVSYGYDANGCTISRGSQSVKYNPENMPVRVSASGTICRFAYDGDNIRRKRLDSNGTIHYVGTYERNVGNGLDSTEVVTKYYIALGKTIAMRKAGTLYYVGSDHLGSTIRVVDASFNAVDQMRYKPYGEPRDPGTNLKTDHKFTSQIEDAVIGLYWYNSRAYDPTIGRFTAPDTIVPEPKNPQALNRYAYTLNNPLKYVDPSGHDVSGWFDDAWQQEFRDAHDGADPTAADYVYRLVTMAAASGLNAVLPLSGGQTQTEGFEPAEGDEAAGFANIDISAIAAGILIPFRNYKLYLESFAERGIMLVDSSTKGIRGGSRLFNLANHPPIGWHVNADVGPLRSITTRYSGHPAPGQFLQGVASQLWVGAQGAAAVALVNAQTSLSIVATAMSTTEIPVPLMVPRFYFDLLQPGGSLRQMDI